MRLKSENVKEKISGGKISVYLEYQTYNDVKLLASYDDITITELVTIALKEYLSKRTEDVEDERRRALEREQHKAQKRKDDE